MPNKDALIVQKYGGTSVGSVDKIKAIAQEIVAKKHQGKDLVVVVSAMARTTEELLSLAREVASTPAGRELDVLLSTGEISSAALLTMAIRALGEEAISLTGTQAGIVTNGVHLNARIEGIQTSRIWQELKLGRVVVVAGFQGRDRSGEVTTLGRGGSDTTAAALAAALEARACQIFTDVDGVYTADPKTISNARPIPILGSDEMQELAWCGAQVLKAEAVEFAKTNGVDLEVRSTFGDGQGTYVRTTNPLREESKASFRPRKPAVAGVAGRTDLLRLRCRGGVLSENELDELFREIAGYDLVFGDLDSAQNDFDLLLSTLEIPDVQKLYVDLDLRFGNTLSIETDLGAVSLVGFGIGSRPGDLWRARQALANDGIRVQGSFTGREALSLVLKATRVKEGVRCLHQVFIEGRGSGVDHERSIHSVT